jgi:hypothetical protein
MLRRTVQAAMVVAATLAVIWVAGVVVLLDLLISLL